jgi:hypothetical protein
MSIDLTHYAARLAALRDEEIADSERCKTDGHHALAQEYWAAARAYRLAISSLHIHSEGEYGQSLQEQPTVSWAKGYRDGPAS